MRHFIFLSNEGITKTPKYQNIENLQVLGFGQGVDEKDALRYFEKENAFLKHSGFCDVIVMELVHENQYYFTIFRKNPNYKAKR